MSNSRYLGKAAESYSRGAFESTPSLGGLPTDLLREGVRRLGLACLIYAGTFFFAFFGPGVSEWLRTSQRPEHFQGYQVTVAFLSILLALVMFGLTRAEKLRDTTLLDIGLLFEVVGAFGIAMSSVHGVFPTWSWDLMRATRFMGIPWECVWILIYPVMAPNTPGKTLLASLGAASMGLVVILISKSSGATSPEAPMSFFLIYYLFSTYLCAFMAFFISRVNVRYAMRLKKAREIGQYQLVELLGAGGMGEVWRAEHAMLARPAAIKLIRSAALGGSPAKQQEAVNRFVREAQATAALQSVHTIDIYDFGITDRGAFYYVMELLDGMDLEAFVKRFGPVPAGRTISLLRQACHSLQEAHTQGLIHRDIKPANLYICRLGPDHDFVKVLDFGLVISSPSSMAEMTRLTQEGAACGTPDYMPPEAALGKSVDVRADIYALGCVGYWLLTGCPVFEGDSPVAVLLDHVRKEPIPPSQRTEIEVPADLEKVILSCLAKDAAVRPQSAGELDSMLAACVATHEWNADQANQWWKLHMPLTS